MKIEPLKIVRIQCVRIRSVAFCRAGPDVPLSLRGDAFGGGRGTVNPTLGADELKL